MDALKEIAEEFWGWHEETIGREGVNDALSALGNGCKEALSAYADEVGKPAEERQVLARAMAGLFLAIVRVSGAVANNTWRVKVGLSNRKPRPLACAFDEHLNDCFASIDAGAHGHPYAFKSGVYAWVDACACGASIEMATVAVQDLFDEMKKAAQPEDPNVRKTWHAEVFKPKHSDGAASIAAERQRQIEAEGWTPEHDDQWRHFELTQAAMAYAASAAGVNAARMQEMHCGDYYPVSLWPWAHNWDKRPGRDAGDESRRRALVKAGALIAAEIDRLDREHAKGGEG